MKHNEKRVDASKQGIGERIKDTANRVYKVCSSIPWGAMLAAVRRFSKKKLLPVGFLLLGFAVLLSGVSVAVSAAVCDKTEEQIVTPESLSVGEKYDYIVVLGCGVYADGTPSNMLYDRVKTAVELYRAGISDKILMSGDNQSEAYNEIAAMKGLAEELGVPSEAIETDAYGLSTYDSIARFSKNGSEKRIVIVTQRYHLYRALFLAEKFGMEAVGVSADLRTYTKQYSREIREILARCKDVYYASIKPEAAVAPEEIEKNKA